MGKARIIPQGQITLSKPSTHRPANRVMPPKSFDASAVNLKKNLCSDDWHGFYPVDLDASWLGKLALKFSKPGTTEAVKIHKTVQLSEAQWYSWLDAHDIGVMYYGMYEFLTKRSPVPKHGLLLEVVQNDPIVLAHGTTSFSQGSEDAQRIQTRWNDTSRQKWARIRGAMLAGGVIPTDLQLLLNETGRLDVIDPEKFQQSLGTEHASLIRQMLDEVEKPLKTLVRIT